MARRLRIAVAARGGADWAAAANDAEIRRLKRGTSLVDHGEYYCAAQQRLGPRVRDDAGIACRLIEAGGAAEAYAIIQHAEPNRAKRVFCRSYVTGSPKRRFWLHSSGICGSPCS